jgi:hypothetical protein
MTPERLAEITNDYYRHRAQSPLLYGELCDDIASLLADVGRLKRERDALVKACLRYSSSNGWSVRLASGIEVPAIDRANAEAILMELLGLAPAEGP